MSGKRKSLAPSPEPDKPLTLAHLLRGKGGLRNAVSSLTWTTGTTARLRRAIATELAELTTLAAGARGGKTPRTLRVEIEKYMLEKLERGVPREVILDGAESMSDLKRETLERYYLRPVLRRVRPVS